MKKNAKKATVALALILAGASALFAADGASGTEQDRTKAGAWGPGKKTYSNNACYAPASPSPHGFFGRGGACATGFSACAGGGVFRGNPRGPGMGSATMPQGNPDRVIPPSGPGFWNENNSEEKNLSGKISLSGEQVLISDDKTTYYVIGINRLIGTVEGLSDGADVELKGYANALNNADGKSFFRATVLTFNGQNYMLMWN